MAIVFSCKCGREIRVKDELAGRKGKCPACGGVIQVPTHGEAAFPSPPEAAPPPPQPPREAETPAPETAPTKPCVHCGKLIPVDAVFCVNCGTHLRTGKKLDAGEVAQTQEDYDYFKVAPDMITSPVATVHRLCESPLSAANMKKAVIFFAIGWLLLTLVVPKISSGVALQSGLSGSGAGSLKLWHYVLVGFIALVVVVTDLVIVNAAGAMFGSPGTGMPNVFVSILAAHALVGLSMIVPVLFLFSFKVFAVITWVSLALRLGLGTWFLYGVIMGAYDTGPVPAGLFAAASSLIRALLFFLGGLLTGTSLI